MARVRMIGMLWDCLHGGSVHRGRARLKLLEAEGCAADAVAIATNGAAVAAAAAASAAAAQWNPRSAYLWLAPCEKHEEQLAVLSVTPSMCRSADICQFPSKTG